VQSLFTTFIARMTPLGLDWDGYCYIAQLITFLSAIFFYVSSIVFWFQRLVLVFKESVVRINETFIRWFYAILTIVTLFSCAFAIWLGVTSDCVYIVTSKDYDIMGKKVYYQCFQPMLPYRLLSAAGAVITFVMNSVIAYMYISRMLRIMRKMNEGLDIQRKPTTNIEMQSHSEVMSSTGDDPVESKTADAVTESSTNNEKKKEKEKDKKKEKRESTCFS